MFRFSFLVFISGLLIISSCHRADRDKDQSTVDCSDNNLAEAGFNDIHALVKEAAENEPGLRAGSLLSCATVNVDTLSFPMTVLIDFGSSNCLGSDGRYRRGIVYATFTGKYRDSLSVITITTQNYFLNDYKIEGTKTITNRGHNSSGNLWYTIVVQNGKITSPAGDWNITYTSNRSNEWIAGESTVLLSDDVYLITGNASGVNRRGNSFTATITTALRVELSCAWIVSGNIEVQPQNLSVRYVDFGNGSCDNLVTVVVNGYNFEIQMN